MVDITRTAKGTATSKTSGTSLAVNSVAMVAGDAMVVGVVYDTGQGAPTVAWGNRNLSQIQLQTESGAATAIFLLRHINNAATRNVVATWAGNITAKAMFVTAISGVKIQDVSQSAGQAATTDPATGTAVTSTQPDTISIAAFGHQGPPSDTVGTVGSGHTSGQRAGTSGAPPASNVTIHETFEILSATGSVRATKTGATSRSWANVILAVKESLRFRQGITPNDLRSVEEIFDTAAVDFNDAIFRFNPQSDQWEAYEQASLGTLRATRDAAGDWS